MWLPPNLEVHSFEPNPSAYSSLLQKIGPRGSNQTKLIHAALSSEESQEECFFVPELADGSIAEQSSLRHGFASASDSDVFNIDPWTTNTNHRDMNKTCEAPPVFSTMLIPVTTLDQYTKTARLSAVDVLKIDVEGYEALVLEGATKLLKGELQATRRPAVIIFEYSQAWTQAADPSVHCLKSVTGRLADDGYQSFLLGSASLVRVDRECWHPTFEFWWWSNVVAIDPVVVDSVGLQELYRRIRRRAKVTGGE